MTVAIILCGGSGIRLASTNTLPKALLKIGDRSILDFALLQAFALPVTYVHVITNADTFSSIQVHINRSEHHGKNIILKIAENASLGNGMTLFEGIKDINDDFFVLMSDHLIEMKAIHTFANIVSKMSDPHCLLACDLDVKNIFDLDDATKVLVEENKIIEIGKSLKHFNAIDMGLFYFPKKIISCIHQAIAKGSTSLTEIVQFILRENTFEIAAMKNFCWQDIDSKEMLEHANKLFNSSVKIT